MDVLGDAACCFNPVCVPWSLATGEDLRYPATEGGHATPIMRLLQRYVDAVIRLGVSDVAAYDAFWQVLHMRKPPSSLLAPGLLMRVLAGKGKRAA